jgi:hypothetical protein
MLTMTPQLSDSYKTFDKLGVHWWPGVLSPHCRKRDNPTCCNVSKNCQMQMKYDRVQFHVLQIILLKLKYLFF